MPRVMQPLRRLAAESRDLADVRSASVGLTPAGGHPHQLRRAEGDPAWPTATTPEEVSAFVDDRISEGADYLKVLIEDGRVLGGSVPVLDESLLVAMVQAGHARGKLVLAHALTLATAVRVTAAGADALTHLFVDAPPTAEAIDQIAQAGLFVIPTLSTLASITGQGAGTALARRPQVRSRVPAPWLTNLSANWATQPPENFEFAPGKRADLLLVDGDPTRTISDTLLIRAVWRQGTRPSSEPLATPTPA
jgi:imidazolonepropionase-like amidohydrolase